MTEMERAQKFAAAAPKLSKKELDALNDLFPAYAFRRNARRDIWTTCCGKYGKIPNTSAGDEIVHAHHEGEPKGYEYKRMITHQCPFCGKPVIVKELGRTGQRGNLSAYRRAIILRWYKGTLWGTGYECVKEYKDPQNLTEKPQYELVAVYRFQPGKAESCIRYYYNNRSPFTNITCQEGPLRGAKWHIDRPFRQTYEYGTSYSIIGASEIQKSPLRYCFQNEKSITPDVIALTACCIYPRQIEMLMKAGMEDVVYDLLNRGVKHATAIKWDSQDVKNPFALNRQQMREFFATNRKVEILELFHRLKGTASIAQCAEWVKKGIDIHTTPILARRWNIPLHKLIKYLEGYVGCAKYGGLQSIDSACRVWRDYVEAAQYLDYPLHRENVIMPPHLSDAHDEAVRLRNRQIAEENKKQRQQERVLIAKTYEKRKQALEKRYGYEADGYRICIPECASDIKNEGIALKHCVGGYAERHIKGTCTILFMRKVSNPDVPFLTIEMRGNTLVQIHGYRNEGCYTTAGRFAPDPREVYREFLDTWLSWLKAGSKRNKDGTPKIKNKKEKIA